MMQGIVVAALGIMQIVCLLCCASDHRRMINIEMEIDEIVEALHARES